MRHPTRGYSQQVEPQCVVCDALHRPKLALSVGLHTLFGRIQHTLSVPVARHASISRSTLPHPSRSLHRASRCAIRSFAGTREDAVCIASALVRAGVFFADDRNFVDGDVRYCFSEDSFTAAASAAFRCVSCFAPRPLACRFVSRLSLG